jgi:hypothetical protein
MWSPECQVVKEDAMIGRWFLVVALLILIVAFPPLVRGPLGLTSAYAEAVDARGGAEVKARPGGLLRLFTVVSSNENERKDQEERRGREDNQHSNNDDEDDSPPPPPRQVSAPAPPPPPPPPANEAGGCLQAGDSATLALAGGSATINVFQNGVAVQLSRVEPGSLPQPGGLLDQLIFRLSASPCGGQPYGSLPGEANLGVAYSDGVASGHDEGKFALMFYDGTSWTPAPKGATDPGHNFASASVTGLGVYALVER